MRKITIEIKDSYYLDFQSADNNSSLKVDEKILEIIQGKIVIEKKWSWFLSFGVWNDVILWNV